MNLISNPALVNWEMGTYIIAFFFVVCAGLVLVVFSMMNEKKDK
jgi:phosphatidylserine synthase